MNRARDVRQRGIREAVVRGDPRLVRYRGTRAALVRAGAVERSMFPEEGGNRRYGGKRWTAEYFVVTRRGPDDWLVTRCTAKGIDYGKEYWRDRTERERAGQVENSAADANADLRRRAWVDNDPEAMAAIVRRNLAKFGGAPQRSPCAATSASDLFGRIASMTLARTAIGSGALTADVGTLKILDDILDLTQESARGLAAMARDLADDDEGDLRDVQAGFDSMMNNIRALSALLHGGVAAAADVLEEAPKCHRLPD